MFRILINDTNSYKSELLKKHCPFVKFIFVYGIVKGKRLNKRKTLDTYFRSPFYFCFGYLDANNPHISALLHISPGNIQEIYASMYWEYMTIYILRNKFLQKVLGAIWNKIMYIKLCPIPFSHNRVIRCESLQINWKKSLDTKWK